MTIYIMTRSSQCTGAAGSSSTSSMVNFEAYTGRILHGVIKTAHQRSKDAMIKTIDLAAVQAVSLDITHFGSEDEMDRAVFLMAQPAGAIVSDAHCS